MMKYHYVHEMIKKKEITFDFIPSTYMVIDNVYETKLCVESMMENLFGKTLQ